MGKTNKFIILLVVLAGMLSLPAQALHGRGCGQTVLASKILPALSANIDLQIPLVAIPQVIDSVVVVLERDGKILMSLRDGSVGKDTWAFVGGKADPEESVAECAIREVREEIGVELKNLQLLHATYTYQYENSQWYRVFVLRARYEGEIEIKEPHKIQALEWFAPDNLPMTIFQPIRSYLPEVLRKLRN